MSTGDDLSQPDFLSYHRSLQNELDSIKDRVRNLIRHWATDGAFKETALRAVLRRHLPESLLVGTGFIVTRNECSRQIDILIVDRDMPTLFKDGDLLIVTPEVVRGIIEVKTSLSGLQAIEGACSALMDNARICHASRTLPVNRLWTGLYVYDVSPNQERNILSVLGRLTQNTRIPINAVSYGGDTLIHFAGRNRLSESLTVANAFVAWNTPGVASAYFVGLMLNRWYEVSVYSEPIAWLPGQATNRPTLYVQPYSGEGVQEFRGDATGTTSEEASENGHGR